MNIHQRIVCQAFGVPDVLSEENQLTAAGAALLRAAGLEEGPGLEPFQGVARIYVEVVADMLKSNRLDPLIGDYVDGERQSNWAVLEAVDAAAGRLVQTGGPPHPEDATKLASITLQRVIDWTRDNPDALRKLRPRQ
jgi:hypothetical protein